MSANAPIQATIAAGLRIVNPIQEKSPRNTNWTATMSKKNPKNPMTQLVTTAPRVDMYLPLSSLEKATATMPSDDGRRTLSCLHDPCHIKLDAKTTLMEGRTLLSIYRKRTRY